MPPPAAHDLPTPRPVSPPSFRAACRVWLQTGLLGFGGPAGQIALLHRSVVEQRGWIAEEEFQRALSFCFLLPGPEAQQLATYLGWRLHGLRGGVVAGTLFWLPGALLLWALSWIYVRHGTRPDIAAVFGGLQSAVVAVVLAALWRLGRTQLRSPLRCLVAGITGLGLAIGIWFPLLILGAGFAGWWLAPDSPPPPGPPDTIPFSNRAARTGRTLLVWLAVWWLPLLIPGLLWGWDQIGARLGGFFSQTALVTFGGAYAVLPYVATRAQAEGWVTASEMLDGLALGETTPGPLVLVLQWIGFLAGWKQPTPFSPLGGATLGALVTSWATFAPSFVWIFAGAPWMDPLRRTPGVGRFLQGVSAAVVGLIASLAVHLATAVWTTHARPWSPDFWAIGLSIAAVAGLVLRRWPAAVVITACGLANWLRSRWA